MIKIMDRLYIFKFKFISGSKIVCRVLRGKNSLTNVGRGPFLLYKLQWLGPASFSGVQ